ncbi:GNAT family N-acetyltransferase [Lentzea californiensis]|uniref:GNAT family N-acetyltransferase n=1 Tax=Lentzea californiensis TaxID=438851 RepID=UPI0021648DE3|nr:GNAT family N-acetyltransferase [Lentzea californiensis]MCR3746067.1 Acetyltransferase (GNAT) domain-containing protein [Lentzea californiensis]
MTAWTSASLDAHHDLHEFDCGVPVLNEWLKGHAMSAANRGTARTYVWTDADSDHVVAYYAITPHVVKRDEVSSKLASGLAVIPGYLLAELALDQSLHGQGLGGELLHDALSRMVEAANVASGRLIVVDAIDDTAAKFYQRYDFQPVKDNPRRLVIKIAAVRHALGP